MIRSVYEYNHAAWKQKSRDYKFSGVPINTLTQSQLRAALAFMVQFAGDLNNELKEAKYG